MSEVAWISPFLMLYLFAFQAEHDLEESSPFLPPPPPPPMPPLPESGRAGSSSNTGLDDEPKYARVDVRSKRSADSRHGTPRRDRRG